MPVFIPLVLILSGCATTVQTSGQGADSQRWIHNGRAVTYLHERHGPDFEQAEQGQRMLLGETPWGQQTALQVDRTFFAASGMPCFSAHLSSAEQESRPVNICRYPDGQWGVSRDVTRHFMAEGSNPQQGREPQ